MERILFPHSHFRSRILVQHVYLLLFSWINYMYICFLRVCYKNTTGRVLDQLEVVITNWVFIWNTLYYLENCFVRVHIYLLIRVKCHTHIPRSHGPIDYLSELLHIFLLTELFHAATHSFSHQNKMFYSDGSLFILMSEGYVSFHETAL